MKSRYILVPCGCEYGCSFAGSSYVEEEHYTTRFMTVTVLLLHARHLLKPRDYTAGMWHGVIPFMAEVIIFLSHHLMLLLPRTGVLYGDCACKQNENSILPIWCPKSAVPDMTAVCIYSKSCIAYVVCSIHRTVDRTVVYIENIQKLCVYPNLTRSIRHELHEHDMLYELYAWTVWAMSE